MKKRSVFEICLAVMFLLLASAGAQGAIVVPENPDVPVWEIGDQWCMGYEDEFTDEDLFDDMETEYFDVSKMEVEGTIGYYRALTVEDNDATVTVGETEYVCYDVYYEEYIAIAAYMDIAMSMDFASMMEEFEEYGTRQYEEVNYEELLADMRIDMSMDGYMWFDLEITGHIYFTVEELAIAKGSFEFVLNSDVDFLYDITYSGAFAEEMYSGYTRQNDDVVKEEPPTDPGDGDSVRMYYSLKQTITDWKASYDIFYNPPLDIFDFPINDYEHWDASSQVTIILNEFSGMISYDMTIEMPEIGSESDKGEIDLSEGLDLPITIGPEWVEYSFRNSEQETITLPDNTETTAYKIGPQYSWYREEDYSENALNNYWSPDSYVETDIEDPSVIGSEELDAEDQPNPIDAMARSENWYSFNDKNFISAELPDSESEDPFTNGEEEDELEPQTYSEVTTFNEVTRDDIKSDYEGYKAASKESSDDEDSGLEWAFIILTIAVIVILICILGIWARKRSRRRQWQQQPGAPAYGAGTQYQPPGDRAPQPTVVQQPQPTQPAPPPPPPDYQPPQPQYQPPPQQPYYPPQQQQYPPRNY